jgi:Spy/CpxP family protein refolding chaperone
MIRVSLSIPAAGTALAVLIALPALSPGGGLQAQSNAASPALQASQAPIVPEELKALFEGTTLTEAQVRQVVAIHRKYPAAAAAQPDSSRAGMAAGAVGTRADEAKELRTILTPDQQKVFDRNLAKVKPTRSKPAY